jgi:hypothetical protein
LHTRSINRVKSLSLSNIMRRLYLTITHNLTSDRFVFTPVRHKLHQWWANRSAPKLYVCGPRDFSNMFNIRSPLRIKDNLLLCFFIFMFYDCFFYFYVFYFYFCVFTFMFFIFIFIYRFLCLCFLFLCLGFYVYVFYFYF